MLFVSDSSCTTFPESAVATILTLVAVRFDAAVNVNVCTALVALTDSAGIAAVMAGIPVAVTVITSYSIHYTKLYDTDCA